MRTLQSTYDSVTEDLDEEERDALVALARVGTKYRSTYAAGRYQEENSTVELRAYATEDGEQRWAVLSDSPDSSDVADTADEAEAVAAYESEVRGLAGCAGKDDPPWWTESDVDGVPHGLYTLLVERQDDEEWTTVHEAQEHLGRVPKVPDYTVRDSCEPWTLTGAAGAITEEVVRAQAGMNYAAAMHEALGWPVTDATAQSVRVTVTGVGAAGEETHTEEREVPANAPTAQEIEDHRRHMAAVEAEMAERAAYDAYDD
ncbi:hypothetical protein ACIQ9R_36240 [Streptomyces sp. NPDC094447]|uniref:hypothetical protein n=1 Tax=Streptomyces sp. NPDC094447 TaxID=3366062 RepID=UPI003818035C